MIENAYCFPAIFFWINLQGLTSHLYGLPQAVKAPVTGLQSSKRSESGTEVMSHWQKFAVVINETRFSDMAGEKSPTEPLVRQSPDDSHGIAMTFFKFH